MKWTCAEQLAAVLLAWAVLVLVVGLAHSWWW